jgi:hypothetical protein
MRKLMCATAAVLAFAGPAWGAETVATASGQGQVEDGRTFAFTVEIFADGTADGMAVLVNRNFSGASGTSPYKAKFEIKCAQRVGNTVVFGGTTNRTNDPNWVDAAFFSVQDHGEPGKGVDKVSRVFFWDDNPTTTGDPMACLLTPINLFPLETIQAGNVQVKSEVDPLVFKE